MKTGFAIFVIGLILAMMGVSAPDEAPLVVAVAVSVTGLFLMWAGVKLMKGKGSLVDNPTL
jgi:sulfite exporter TauE/SafE